MLMNSLLDIMGEWRLAFSQDRVYARALRQSLAGLLSLGTRTISRMIACLGRDQQDWSSEYRLHSRSEWSAEDLFDPILKRAHPLCGETYVNIGFDDTRLHKTGRKIPGASYWADPLSPAFHLNFMLGLRYLQASLLIPHYREVDQTARGVPVRFTEVPAVKKPGKRASDEERKTYREAIKTRNLSTAFVSMLQGLRKALDMAGGTAKTIIAVLDGSFCNRACLTADIERVIKLARVRKDAKLCYPAPDGGKRVYGTERFTPEDVRQNDSIPWKTMRVFNGGKWRQLRYKDVGPVLWQGGTQRKPMRLLVLAPTPYRVTSGARLYYKAPAYLLCTDLDAPAEILIQAYIDRWQIEVNHRDEKTTLGVGQAQVWSAKSVPRQPAFMVAAYSALLLAAIETFGPARTSDYMPLPKWRRGASRPSLLDMIRVLRKEIAERPDCTEILGPGHEIKTMLLAAAA
jgi:hypothetical protein